MTEPAELIDQYRNGLHLLNECHHMAAKRYDRLARLLGGAVVLLTAVVGTTVFQGLENDSDRTIQTAAGVASVVASALAAIQTFLRYPSLAEKHRTAAIRYGIIRRDLEIVRAFQSEDSRLQEALIDIKTRWSEIDEIAPSLPQGLLRRAPRRLRRTSRKMAPFRRDTSQERSQ